MKLSDEQEIQSRLTPNSEQVVSDIESIMVELLKLTPKIQALKGDSYIYKGFFMKAIVGLHSLYDDIRGVVLCDICGDYHETGSVPISCESGDGA